MNKLRLTGLSLRRSDSYRPDFCPNVERKDFFFFHRPSLIAQDTNNKEITAALFVSEGTVLNHIAHTLSRLNVLDRTQAAIVAH
ncbi:MAG: response regulator transcription factor [Phormidesmis sp.]